MEWSVATSVQKSNNTRILIHLLSILYGKRTGNGIELLKNTNRYYNKKFWEDKGRKHSRRIGVSEKS
jgi:hypothetical protein